MRSFALAFDSASCLSRRHLVVVVTTRLWERCGTDGLVPAMKLQFKLQCMLTWERIYFIQTISELKVSYVVHETLNPLSPKVSLVILLTVCLQFSLYQFGEFGNRSISNLMIYSFFSFSSLVYCIDKVRRNSFLIWLRPKFCKKIRQCV